MLVEYVNRIKRVVTVLAIFKPFGSLSYMVVEYVIAD
jgi:hypothetical protein